MSGTGQSAIGPPNGAPKGFLWERANLRLDRRRKLGVGGETATGESMQERANLRLDRRRKPGVGDETPGKLVFSE